MPLDWSPLWLSLRFAGLATLLAAIAGLPLAWLLVHRRFRGCELLDALANLPLALPPAVFSYYLLTALGRWPIAFSLRWAVALSAIYTLPLVLRMSRAGLEGVDPAFENAARILGAPEWRVFWRIAMPLSWRALAGAGLAAFARAFVDFAAATLVMNRVHGAGVIVPLFGVVALTALGALYMGNRLRRERVYA